MDYKHKKIETRRPFQDQSPSKMDFVELDDSHYECVKGVFKAAFDQEKYPEDDLKVSWDYRSHENSFGFLLKGKLFGFVLASFHKKNGKNMYIDYIALAPEFRGNGLGSSLMTLLIKKCYKEGGSLHLFPERQSLHAWYERYGFYKTTKNYLTFHSYGTRRQSPAHSRLGLKK